MKRKVSLVASVMLHAGILLFPFSDPVQSKMLDFVEVAFPENFAVSAAEASENSSGNEHAEISGAPAITRQDYPRQTGPRQAGPRQAGSGQAREDPFLSAAPALQEPEALEAPAQTEPEELIRPMIPPAPQQVVAGPAMIMASPQFARAPEREGAGDGSRGAGMRDNPAHSIGEKAGTSSPESGIGRGSVTDGGSGKPQTDDRGAGLPGTGVIGAASINHLANFRAAVAKTVGAEAERRFKRRAVREDEGLVKVRVRVHPGGRIQLLTVHAEQPLLSDIIDDALRSVEAPSPPTEVALPVEISFRFRFVLE